MTDLTPTRCSITNSQTIPKSTQKISSQKYSLPTRTLKRCSATTSTHSPTRIKGRILSTTNTTPSKKSGCSMTMSSSPSCDYSLLPRSIESINNSARDVISNMRTRIRNFSISLLVNRFKNSSSAKKAMNNKMCPEIYIK